MKIAIISKLWESTDPYSTGGTGMSVGTLVNGLIKRGHQITVFAAANSKTKAELISVKSRPYKNNYSEVKEYQNIYRAFKDAHKFDVIHTNIEHKACFFAPLIKTPTLITLRYGQFFKDEIDLLKDNRKLNFSFNSIALQKKLSFLNSVGVVYNGLNLDNYRFNSKPEDYLLFLGRLSPQKGVHLAVKAALKSKHTLIIAGKTVKADEQYLKKYVLPFVDNKKIIYLGEQGFRQKIELLKNAYALIQPTQFFEACSNSILEAQACGTPVITFNQGSNKELLKNFKTGILANQKNLVKSIEFIKKIKRSVCRRWIESNFSQQRMVSGYEHLYEKLVKKI